MTVHAAKGLEFDTVFVAAVENGLFPHARSIEEDERNLQEERRLFYVALTRARRRLFVTASVSRSRRGQVIETGPSRFVEELPEDGLLVLSGAEDFVSEQEAVDSFAELKSRFR
jgi:DNA helicase-2/ATP-dependent DNA helicase PcrA